MSANVAILEQMKRLSIDFNAGDLKSGRTPLHHAVEINNAGECKEDTVENNNAGERKENAVKNNDVGKRKRKTPSKTTTPVRE